MVTSGLMIVAGVMGSVGGGVASVGDGDGN